MGPFVAMVVVPLAQVVCSTTLEAEWCVIAVVTSTGWWCAPVSPPRDTLIHQDLPRPVSPPMGGARVVVVFGAVVVLAVGAAL